MKSSYVRPEYRKVYFFLSIYIKTRIFKQIELADIYHIKITGSVLQSVISICKVSMIISKDFFFIFHDILFICFKLILIKNL